MQAPTWGQFVKTLGSARVKSAKRQWLALKEPQPSEHNLLLDNSQRRRQPCLLELNMVV